jgi:glucan 1,3-beta-glucosidase
MFFGRPYKFGTAYSRAGASGSDKHPTPLYGVNLGGWLVLERWITPSVFRGLKARDEYSLCQNGGPAIRNTIRRHRDTFVTRSDFEWLKQNGIEAVRLPVGHWVFGDTLPYFGTIEYVDKAFEWAEQTGIKILLDLHGVPGSQNGADHSGRKGKVKWHKAEKNIIDSLDVIDKLARRYGQNPQLLGIEMLNEPKANLPRRTLIRYYVSAYSLIRAHCPSWVWVVMSDGFRPRRWKRALPKSMFSRVYIDTHQYRAHSRKDKKRPVGNHLLHTLNRTPRQLLKMARHHPVVVGEWSLALDKGSLKGLSDEQKLMAYRSYGAAQMMAYSEASAWFYWTYRTEDGGTWSFRDCIEQGLLPHLSAE